MGKLVGNYHVSQKVTAPSTSTVTIKGHEVGRNKTAILTFMSVMDYTMNANEAMLGIIDASGVEHMLDFKLGTATDVKQCCKIEGKILLLSGDRPFGRVLSPTANDVIYFTAHGSIYSMEIEGAA